MIVLILSLVGLIDEGETVEEAAKRELYEETGYTADDILEVSPVVVSDPGISQKKNLPRRYI